MKKILFTLAVLGAVVFNSLAQTSSSPAKGSGKFSIGLESGLPTGDASDVTDAVIGGSIKYEVPVATNAYFTLSAGYNAFLVKSEFKEDGSPSTLNFVPLKAGIKYYSDGGFFLEAQAGVVFSTQSGGGNAFIYSPGIGYTFNGGFEAGVRYEGWPKDGGTTSQIGLRLAFRF